LKSANIVIQSSTTIIIQHLPTATTMAQTAPTEPSMDPKIVSLMPDLLGSEHAHGKLSPRQCLEMIISVRKFLIKHNEADADTDDDDDDEAYLDELRKCLPKGSATLFEAGGDLDYLTGTDEYSELMTAVMKRLPSGESLCASCNSESDRLAFAAGTPIPGGRIGEHYHEDYILPLCTRCNHDAEGCGSTGHGCTQDWLQSPCLYCRQQGKKMRREERERQLALECPPETDERARKRQRSPSLEYVDPPDQSGNHAGSSNDEQITYSECWACDTNAYHKETPDGVASGRHRCGYERHFV
jgi:hypothetical protein